MTYLALFLLVLDLTGSTAAIALMSILVALPPVTVGLFAGAWADRHDRRRIMLASDSLRAVVVLGMVLAATREAAAAPVRARLPAGGHRHLLLAGAHGDGPARRPAPRPCWPRTPSARRRAWSRASSAPGSPALIAGDRRGRVAGPRRRRRHVPRLRRARDRRHRERSGGPTRRPPPRRKTQGLGGAVADGLRLIARSPALVAALGGVSVVDARRRRHQRPVHPVPVTDLGASPAWAGPLEARPDALDDPGRCA